MKKSSSFNVLLGEGALQNRWRQNTGASFIRIRKNKLFFRSQFIYLILIILIVLIVYIVLPTKSRPHFGSYKHLQTPAQLHQMKNEIPTNPGLNYNANYPLTKPIVNVHDKTTMYKVGLIADLDTNSRINRDSEEYASFYKHGYVTVSSTHTSFDFKFDVDSKEITSGYSLKGRGMELSELVTFNGRLFTFDDRTGIVFEIANDTVAPWVILTDGETISAKGFKSEWSTVKNEQLYVGSMGKEWTNAGGDFQNYNPMMVKVIGVNGEVKTLNWVQNYKALRKAIDIDWPGYLIHESGAWSEINQKWFFLPRRCSPQKYNETLDEMRGCNYLLIASDDFSDVQKIKIGELKPTRGFSSFKFVPDSHDSIIIALKTEELNGSTSTYVTVFDTKGNILHDDEKIHTDYKYEGFEFI